MDNRVIKIQQQAAEIADHASEWHSCPMCEYLPAYLRKETDVHQTEKIQEHLKTCKECNMLLLALVVSEQKDPQHLWVKNENMFALSPAVPVIRLWVNSSILLRGPENEYRLSQKRLELPNGQTVCIQTVVRKSHRMLTMFLENGDAARYELYNHSGEMLKSVDNAHQFKFDMPSNAVTLVISDQFMIHFEGEEHV